MNMFFVHDMISTNVSESETLSLKLHYVAVHKAPKYRRIQILLIGYHLSKS